jgi:hypothetical protein
MRKTSLCLAMLGAMATLPAMAQSQMQTTPDRSGTNAPSARTESSPPAVTMDNGTRTTANPPATGANSFTEGQARSRIEAAGFSGVDDLRKDDQGVWRARAMRGGQQVNVGLDYQGNVTTR